MRSFFCCRVARTTSAVGNAATAAPSRSISSFHRVAHAHAVRCGLSSSTARGAAIERGAVGRGFSTTAVSLKQQQPTNTGAPAASPRARRRKQAQLQQQQGAAAAEYGAHAEAVAPALDVSAAAAAAAAAVVSLPRPATSPPNAAETGAAAALSHHLSSDSPATRPKGVKRGRRKPNNTNTTTTTGAGTPPAVAHDSTAPLPPLEPPASPLVAAAAAAAAAAASRGKKVGKRRPGSGGAASPCDRATGSDGVLDATAVDEGGGGGSGATGPVGGSLAAHLPLFGAPQPVYYTHGTTDTTPRTEEQRIAERCSIIKLIMVSGSVSFLFTTLPRSKVPLKTYVKDLNRAQAPTPSPPEASESDVDVTQPSPSATCATDGSESGAAATNGGQALPALSERQYLELRQRLCAEQLATNTVFIHVREMEQLVPPLPLQPPTAAPDTDADQSSAAGTSAVGDSVAAEAPAAENAARGRRGRRRKNGRAASSPPAPVTPAPAPPLPVLSPVERLIALQRWKKEAQRRAAEAQARYLVPSHYHAITRVRFHDPHQTDVTVAMGSGGCKSVDSVLRAIARSVPQEERSADPSSPDKSAWLAVEEAEEEESDSERAAPPFELPEPPLDSREAAAAVVSDASAAAANQPAFLASPYTVKPLLTVGASCVPRREAWIGTCAASPSAASPSAEEVKWTPFSVRPLPTVPRYSTRITIMLEHDDMDPADLVSLAEMSTTRKPHASSPAEQRQHLNRHDDVTIRGGGVDAAGPPTSDRNAATAPRDVRDDSPPRKRPMHLYCLVQDAGEY
ncbi:hypothetical protein NESM_000138600 [Novymonas esmeraldas]|uniref:Uncharacterized protein n=1 Tax=Novymonas esmeraldas TaxID=1808958 RepID=A0AAW0F6P6_9TRYP